jgi:hypothetical protein
MATSGEKRRIAGIGERQVGHASSDSLKQNSIFDLDTRRSINLDLSIVIGKNVDQCVPLQGSSHHRSHTSKAKPDLIARIRGSEKQLLD